MAYSAYVENALEMAGPNYDPANVLRTLGQLGLQKKKYKEAFEEDKRRFGAMHQLDLEKFGLQTQQIQDQIARLNTELGLKKKASEFAPQQYFYGSGAGTPQERSEFTTPYGFSTEPNWQIPGTSSYLYGNAASEAMLADRNARMYGTGGGAGGGGAGAGGGSSLAAEIGKLESLASGYQFSQPLSEGHQIYSNLRNRIKELSKPKSWVY